jgi:restriction system protein
LIVQIADDLGLSQDEREQEVPSGGTPIIASRVHWAKTFLKQAGLVEQPKRAMVQITPRGRELLRKNPAKIDSKLLQQFDDFRNFLTRTKSTSESTLGPTPVVLISPEVGSYFA